MFRLPLKKLKPPKKEVHIFKAILYIIPAYDSRAQLDLMDIAIGVYYFYYVLLPID